MFNFIEKLKKINVPFLSSIHIATDMGTANTRIAILDKGIVLREASALGFNNRTKDFVFFGQEAKTIVGKTPEFLKIIKPVVAGVISDFDAEVALIRYFMDKSITPYLSSFKLIKPSIKALTAVPTIATEIERRAAYEVLYKSGVTDVILIEKPLAIAHGAGFDIFSHKPVFIVDLGSGLIEAAIISGGGIVAQKTLKNAGEHMNKLIYNYIHLKHGVILGEMTCEELKVNLLDFTNKEKTLTVRGKSLENGLPKSIRVKTGDVKEALITNFNQIIDSMKELLEISPPEIINEVLERGVVLTGGIAATKGLDKFIAREIKIDVYAVNQPTDATIHGLLKLLKHKEISEKIKI